MAKLLNPFNAHEYDPSQGAPQLPVGRHPVIIIADEVKANKDNSGGYVEFTLKITGGPSANTTGALRLMMYSQSQAAVEFAHRRMSALCHVLNTFNVLDLQALHNKPFMVEVGLQKGEEAAAKGYTEVNKILDANGEEPKKGGQNTGTNVGGQQQGNPNQFNAQMAEYQQGPGGQSHQPMNGGQQSQQQQNPNQGGGNTWQQGNQNNPNNNGGNGGQQPPSGNGWQQGGQQPQQQGNQGGNGGGWQQQNNGGGQQQGAWGQRN